MPPPCGSATCCPVLVKESKVSRQKNSVRPFQSSFPALPSLRRTMCGHLPEKTQDHQGVMVSSSSTLQVEFGAITADNIEQLRKINVASFPVLYNEDFYKDVVKSGNAELNKFAYYRGAVVGAVCARVEAIGDTEQRLYIMTLATLAAYRGRGIGSQLLQSILDLSQKNPSIREIALHVQISNQDAIRFYTERFNFVQGKMVENYYKRIDPPHCYLLYKRLDQ